MTTILDYLKWRGDLSMLERPFQEVDNLIFSELVYYEYSEAMADNQDTITIKEAYDAFTRLSNPHPYASNDPIPLLKACADTARFGNIYVSDFINIIDLERKMQFAAACFHLPDNRIYLAFRGTDNTIVGWREDFNLSYMEEAPAQAEAVKYLNYILEKYPNPLIVGGHSKGGHLAIYASAFCQDSQKDRIQAIYSNDGPGFNQYITNSPKYQEILPKVRLIIPEASVISILYCNKKEKQIVECTVTNGVEQHIPYTWRVECDHFINASSQSSFSVIMDEVLTKWLDSISDQQKQDFINAVFDALEASGCTTLAEMSSQKWISYNAILKAVKVLPAESKNAVLDTVKQFGLAHRDVLWNEAKKKFEPSRIGS